MHSTVSRLLRQWLCIASSPGGALRHSHRIQIGPRSSGKGLTRAGGRHYRSGGRARKCLNPDGLGGKRRERYALTRPYLSGNESRTCQPDTRSGVCRLMIGLRCPSDLSAHDTKLGSVSAPCMRSSLGDRGRIRGIRTTSSAPRPWRAVEPPGERGLGPAELVTDGRRTVDRLLGRRHRARDIGPLRERCWVA